MLSGDGSGGSGSDRHMERWLPVGVWGWMEREWLEAREHLIRNCRIEVGKKSSGLSQSWRQDLMGSDGFLGNRIRVREGQMLKNEP